MRFGWVRAFPKLALVFLVIAGSTGLFGFWWFFWRPLHNLGNLRVSVEDIAPKLALLESKEGRLLLVDNDLYELDSGKLIFRAWLKEGMPERLYYDAATKKFIARYPHGFVRYEASGVPAARLVQKGKPAISDDLKWLLYVKDRDIWRADIDWQQFSLTNEKKVTAVEQFNETYFADNIVLGTHKTLIIRDVNRLVHVNLDSGEVKPFQLTGGDVAKRRSPDSKWVVGTNSGQFYCYDVDANDAKTIAVGRGSMNDYRWLGNDRCVAIAERTKVVLYDRPRHTLTEMVTLPLQCTVLENPSPDNRYVFARGNNKSVLIDAVQRTAVPVADGAGLRWIGDDTFAFSRDLPDSDLRGTWLQKAGENERRISPNPYLVSQGNAFIMPLPSGDQLLFATKHGLTRMKVEGSDATELVKIAQPPAQVIAIEAWKP